jgi:hypothetical protein
MLSLPESYNGESYKIYDYAFAENDSIISVIIPNGVTSIGKNAFYNCNALASVTVAASVTEISENAFYCCYKLAEVVNNSSLTITAGSSTYGHIAKYAMEVHSGSSKIVNINDYLFYTCSGIHYLVGYVGTETNKPLPENYNGETYTVYDNASR